MHGNMKFMKVKKDEEVEEKQVIFEIIKPFPNVILLNLSWARLNVSLCNRPQRLKLGNSPKLLPTTKSN